MSEGYSREQFDRIKAAAESYGYTVVSKWRPGLKNIRLGDIVLSEQSSPHSTSPPCASSGETFAQQQEHEECDGCDCWCHNYNGTGNSVEDVLPWIPPGRLPESLY